MSIFIFISIAVIVLALTITIFIVSRTIISFRTENRAATGKQHERLQPLYEKLNAGQRVTEFDIYEYANNNLTRELTFLLLQERHLTDLFPREFYSIEKAAESNLVNWLEFPTELGACPNEILHLKKVSVDADGQEHFIYYHVYKFRMHEPHWAAGAGWMLGVVGPYLDDSKPYDHPNSTFSRLHRSSDVDSPDEEAQWVHENILLRVFRPPWYPMPHILFQPLKKH